MEENKLLRGALYVVGTPIGNLSDFSPPRGGDLGGGGFHRSGGHARHDEAFKPLRH